ncbi:hypothetical protein BD779DRAFT_1790256, partial [Infundibulicybe gibba]
MAEGGLGGSDIDSRAYLAVGYLINCLALSTAGILPFTYPPSAHHLIMITTPTHIGPPLAPHPSMRTYASPYIRGAGFHWDCRDVNLGGNGMSALEATTTRRGQYEHDRMDAPLAMVLGVTGAHRSMARMLLGVGTGATGAREMVLELHKSSWLHSMSWRT